MEQRTLIKIFCTEELDEAFAKLWQWGEPKDRTVWDWLCFLFRNEPKTI
jgi:hypothetical protein